MITINYIKNISEKAIINYYFIKKSVIKLNVWQNSIHYDLMNRLSIQNFNNKEYSKYFIEIEGKRSYWIFR